MGMFVELALFLLPCTAPVQVGRRRGWEQAAAPEGPPPAVGLGCRCGSSPAVAVLCDAPCEQGPAWVIEERPAHWG